MAASFGRVYGDGTNAVRDQSVKKAAFQDDGTAAQPAPNRGTGPQTERLRVLSPVQDPSKPSEFLDPNITQPPALDQKQLEDAGRMTQEEAAELN